MMLGTPMNELKIQLRIAAPDAGYPQSEAYYSSIKDYEATTGKKFYQSFCDNCGYCNGSCPGCLEREIG